MELKISCDASVKLKKISTIKAIDCNVVDFEVIKDTLNGNIKINGTYIKDDFDKLYEFEELVPFTVVFRDDNFVVEEIVCGNFSYQEVVNQGIECHFDIFITYHKKDEVVMPSEEMVESLPEEPKVEEIKEIEILETVEVDNSDEQITEHYDQMLEDILEKRNDNFFEDESVKENLEETAEEVCVKETDERSEEVTHKEEKVEEIAIEVEKAKDMEVKINKQDKTETAKSIFKNMKESHKTVTVYYLQNETDVDRICQKEKLDINTVYEDYTKNRRIIVK